MTRCIRCSPKTESVPESGVLRLAPPLAHTSKNLCGYLERAGIGYSMPSNGLLELRFSGDTLRRISDGLAEILGAAELRDTRSLIVPDGASAHATDLVAVQPLGALIARVQGDWFLSMLNEQRLTTLFHPIVSAGSPGEVFGYECLVRGVAADGSLVSPDRLYRTAREADLLFPLDRAARLTAIRTASERHIDIGTARLFINFNPSSIYDPVYCLRSTVDAIARTGFSPDRVVFEVVESDHVEDPAHLVRIIQFYREAGFRIALDDLGAGFGSLNLLRMLEPDVVKLDMGLIRGVDRDPFRAGIVRKLLEMARELRIASVAEGIETEAESEWLRRNGADYLQGFLFGTPSNPPLVPVIGGRPGIDASPAEPWAGHADQASMAIR